MARSSMRFQVVLLLAPTIACADSSKAVGMDFTKIGSFGGLRWDKLRKIGQRKPTTSSIQGRGIINAGLEEAQSFTSSILVLGRPNE